VSRDSDHAPFREYFFGRLGLATVNLQTKFEVSNYTHYKHMRAVQNVQIGVVWGTSGSLKVISNVTIR